MIDMTELKEMLEHKVAIYQKNIKRLKRNPNHNFRASDMRELADELRLTPAEFNRLFFYEAEASCEMQGVE